MIKRLSRHIIPSPAALTFLWIGLGIFFITSAFIAVFAIVEGDLFSLFAGISGFSFPGLALMLVIAALRESRPAPRAILWSGVTLSMGLSVAAFVAGLYFDPPNEQVVAWMFCCWAHHCI